MDVNKLLRIHSRVLSRNRRYDTRIDISFNDWNTRKIKYSRKNGEREKQIKTPNERESMKKKH